jgi:hypothetical protein
MKGVLLLIVIVLTQTHQKQLAKTILRTQKEIIAVEEPILNGTFAAKMLFTTPGSSVTISRF